MVREDLAQRLARERRRAEALVEPPEQRSIARTLYGPCPGSRTPARPAPRSRRSPAGTRPRRRPSAAAAAAWRPGRTPAGARPARRTPTSGTGTGAAWYLRQVQPHRAPGVRAELRVADVAVRRPPLAARGQLRAASGSTRTMMACAFASPTWPSGNTVTTPSSGSVSTRTGSPFSSTTREPFRQAVANSDWPGLGPSERIGKIAASPSAPNAPSIIRTRNVRRVIRSSRPPQAPRRPRRSPASATRARRAAR